VPFTDLSTGWLLTCVEPALAPVILFQRMGQSGYAHPDDAFKGVGECISAFASQYYAFWSA
jgi:hypothetical protein